MDTFGASIRMKVPMFRVNAFSSQLSGGNVAIVLVLEHELPASMLQSNATEMAVSETACLLPRADNFGIRWFSPRQELEICGHATLASAAIVFERLARSVSKVDFASQSGPLIATRRDRLIELDFPAFLAEPIPLSESMNEALNARPAEAWRSNRTFAVFADAEEVRRLAPDFRLLADSFPEGFGVTA